MRALVLLLCLLSAQAWGATYYIDSRCVTDGTGATNDCANGATGPKNTLPTPVASDVWHIARGSTFATVAQITLQSSMTIDAYGTGDKPIISCTCGASDVTLYAFNKSSITFRDLDVRRNATSDIRGVITLQGTGGGHLLDGVTLSGGYNNLRILSDAPSITVMNSTFSSAYDDNIYADVSVAFTVTGSTFSTPSTGTSTGDNIQIDSWDGTATITNNVMTPSDNTKQGLIANASLTSAARLVATGNTVTGGKYGINTSVGAVVASNYLTGQSERGINFNPQYASIEQRAAGNIISGSMTTAGIYIEDASAVAVNATVYNNTLLGAMSRGIALKSDVTSGTVTALNNIIVGDNSTGQIGFGCGTVCAQGSENYTRFYNLETNSSEAEGANSTTGDPQFTGGTSPTTASGFKLLPSSPLRRTGFDLNLGNIQDHGNRAFSHPPSIGAWEAASGDVAEERTIRD